MECLALFDLWLYCFFNTLGEQSTTVGAYGMETTEVPGTEMQTNDVTDMGTTEGDVGTTEEVLANHSHQQTSNPINLLKTSLLKKRVGYTDSIVLTNIKISTTIRHL